MVNKATAAIIAKRTVSTFALIFCVSGVASAQNAQDKAASDYAALLETISNLETNIAHQEVFIGTQNARIASLEKQIADTSGVVESIGPMLDKMTTSISAEINSDLPFNLEERNDRLAGFEEILENKEARPADKMRRALGIYDAEVAYGQSIQAYAGNHPDTARAGERLKSCVADHLSIKCGLTKKQLKVVKDLSTDALTGTLRNDLKDGYYLRYGRLALAYMLADESEILRYDPADKAWVVMKGAKALDIRRAMKMARGEAAPNVVQAPIYLAN